jgi:hypothetical protein
MRPTAIVSYLGYMTAVIATGYVLVAAIAKNTLEAEESVTAVHASPDPIDCATAPAALHERLWAWYAADVRAAGPEAHTRGPFPGALRLWESDRRAALEKCGNDDTARSRLETLESMRQRLEANAYLLSQTAGKDIAELRQALTHPLENR